MRRIRYAALLSLMLLRPTAAGADPIRRGWQPLVLKGAKLAPLLGRPIRDLAALAVREGKLEPIPFQVDEALPDGRYALPKGPEPLPDDQRGILDGDDEVAMMISDFGERASDAGMLPAEALEVEIVDPLDGTFRYAYLAAATPPLRSTKDYVDYSPEPGRVESDHYRLGFAHEMPVDFALQSHKQEGRPSLIDRLKSRVDAKVLTAFDFHLTEDDVRSRVVAYNDGPIRVIRRISHSVTLVLGIRSPEVTSYDFFYRDFIENPSEVNLPWVPSMLFGNIRVRFVLDFRDLDGYWLKWSGMQGGPVKVGDPASELAIEAESPTQIVHWIALGGPERTMIQTQVLGPDMEKIEPRLFYRDSSEPDPPEADPGQHPGVGYVTTGWGNLSRGRHRFNSLFIIVPAGRDPSLVFQELETPPVVSVRPVASGRVR